MDTRTVRSLGMTSVCVDKYTRENIKKAAGDKPVSDFLRELFESQELTPGQGVLPGVAKLRASQPASKADVEKLSDIVRDLVAMPFILSAIPFAGKDFAKVSGNIQDTIQYLESKLVALPADARVALRKALDKADTEGAQGQLFDEGKLA